MFPNTQKRQDYRTLYDYVNGSGRLRIIEFEPQRRTIKIFGYAPRNLSFPYIQFIGHSQSLYMTFSQKPLECDCSTAYFPLLPNIYGGANVCLEDFSSALWGETIFDKISYFWQSGFGRDWDGALLCKHHLGGYEQWEKKSEEDPSFILTADLGMGQNFRSILGYNIMISRTFGPQ